MISVLIADDQNIVREGIKIFLAPCTGIEVIGIAKDGEETIKQVKILKPDILLLDVEMPLGNGIEVCHQISHQLSHTKTILLSSHEEKIYIQQGIKAGAKGYILKNATSEDLELAIKLVYFGYSVFKSKLLQKLISKNSPRSASKYAQVNLRVKEEINKQNKITNDDCLVIEPIELIATETEYIPAYIDENSYDREEFEGNRYWYNSNRRRQKKLLKRINCIDIQVWNLCLAIALIIIVIVAIFLSSI